MKIIYSEMKGCVICREYHNVDTVEVTDTEIFKDKEDVSYLRILPNHRFVLGNRRHDQTQQPSHERLPTKGESVDVWRYHGNQRLV